MLIYSWKLKSSAYLSLLYLHIKQAKPATLQETLLKLKKIIKKKF
jgi:hypothetical protein